jgi:hypothetical protein
VSASAGARGVRWIGWALLVLYAVWLLPFSVSPVPGWLPDASLYLLMSEVLSPWPREPSAAAAWAMEGSAFPPLFPILIGLFGPADASVGRAVAALALLAALGALHAWLVARGWSARERLIGIALFALLPGTLMQGLEGMSEPLYLFASLGALAAAARASSEARDRSLAAMWIGAALLTRSIGMTLALAFAVSLRLERAPRPLRALGIALLPIGLWWAAKLFLGFGGSYGEPLRSKLASLHPDLAVAAPLAIAAQLRALVTAWSGLFVLDVDPSLVHHLLAAGIAALALAGLVLRLGARAFDGVYVALYLGLVSVWPFPGHATRFLWPVLPILLVYAAEVARSLARRLGRDSLGPAALALMIAVLALPSLPRFAQRFWDSRQVEYAAFTHTPRWYLADPAGAASDARGRRQLARAMREVAHFAPPDACVQAVSPETLMWWSRRASRTPLLPGVSDAEFEDLERSCPWYFLAPIAVPPFEVPFYPGERLPRGTPMERLPRHGADPALPSAVLMGPRD